MNLSVCLSPFLGILLRYCLDRADDKWWTHRCWFLGLKVWDHENSALRCSQRDVCYDRSRSLSGTAGVYHPLLNFLMICGTWSNSGQNGSFY